MGVEIDAIALTTASEAIGDHEIAELSMVNADAFAANFPSHQFDLVITNPPYIRYQKTEAPDIGIKVPTASDVRRNLIRAIERREGISDAAKVVFLQAASSYSGTSDIAVPAWILAASLVAEGGTLAVVVPQAWISRNYAAPVRAMLDQAFRVDYLLEDGDASWFADAQVRTHLVVARRRPIDGTASGRDDFIHARATRAFTRGERLIGDLKNERAVADALAAVRGVADGSVTHGLTARRERRVVDIRNGPAIPTSIGHLLTGSGAAFETFSGLGWAVGQGMRTGANEFFYLDRDGERVVPAPRWGHLKLQVPDGCLVPTIRRQRDLPTNIRLNSDDAVTELLMLEGWITSQDRDRAIRAGVASSWLSSRYQTLDKAIGDWIEVVGETVLLGAAGTRRFRDLTAVVTNAKTGPGGEPLSFWYQLPALKPRHRPEVFMPRVCGAKPFAKGNDDSDCVVDANFATMWQIGQSALDADAMLALLNSTWTWANLESFCTVLGGGALKVEATDLRRLALPVLDQITVGALTDMGKRLTTENDTDVLNEIDELIAAAIAGPKHAATFGHRLSRIAEGKMGERSTGSK